MKTNQVELNFSGLEFDMLF